MKFGSTNSRSGNQRVFVLLLFLLLCLGIYFPAFTREKIWDDCYLIGQNPFYRSPLLIAEAFRHSLWGDIAPYYRPVQNLTYIAEYWIERDFALLSHWTNVAFHVLSAWLLVLLLGGLKLRVPPAWRHPMMGVPVFAFFIGILWLVHPIHNAAVAYISGRADSLAALFSIAAWLFFEKARTPDLVRSKRIIWGAAAMFSLLIGLCSKEIAITWIGFFLLYQLLARNLRGSAKWWTAGGLGIVLGIYAVLHSLPREVSDSASAAPTPIWFRGALALSALGDYARLLVWPDFLTMERTLTHLRPEDGFLPWFQAVNWLLPTVGLIVAVFFAFGCASAAEGRVLRCLGVGWFLIGFLPISNLMPLMAQSAEHWIYHSSIGLLLFGAGCLAGVPLRYARTTAVIAILAVVPLSCRTWVRSHDWAAYDGFLAHTLDRGVRSPKILGNLSLMLAAQGKFKEQEAVAREFLATGFDTLAGQVELARCLERQGRIAEADAITQQLESELKSENSTSGNQWLRPLYVSLWMERRGRKGDALEVLERVSKAVPGNWTITDQYSRMLARNGKKAEAVALLNRFVEANWWHFEARFRLGEKQVAIHDYENARKSLEFAARLDVHDPEAYALLARIELAEGNMAGAINRLEDSFGRNPEAASPKKVLAQILRARGDIKRAEQLEAEAKPAVAKVRDLQ